MDKCCLNVIEELEAHVQRLRNQSFEAWTPGEIRGYDTATTSIMSAISRMKAENFNYKPINIYRR